MRETIDVTWNLMADADVLRIGHHNSDAIHSGDPVVLSVAVDGRRLAMVFRLDAAPKVAAKLRAAADALDPSAADYREAEGRG